MRSKLVIFIFGVTLSLLGCKQKLAIEKNDLGYIVGPSNDISVFDSNDPRLSLYDFSYSSVLVTTFLADGRIKFCSGTLVAPGGGEQNLRVLTNHHCFAKTAQDGKSLESLLPEACAKTKIYLEFVTGKTLGAASKSCAAGSLRSNFDMDLAVFTLDGAIPAKYRPLPVYKGSSASLAEKSVIVVHYPDVEASRKTPGQGVPALPVAAYTNNDCRITGTFTEQEVGLDRTLPFGLRHTCDLIHGSSGSALLDPVTGMIYGVNWGGIQINHGTGIRTDNVATSAPNVLAFLEGAAKEALLNKNNAEAGGLTAIGKNGSDGVSQKGEDAGSREPEKSKKGCGVVSDSYGTTQGATHNSALMGFLFWVLAGMIIPVTRMVKARVRGDKES